MSEFKRQSILQIYDESWKELVLHMMQDLDQKEIDELQMKILSSRRLLDGEVKVLLDYLAENAQQVEMSVDNIDDWAYDKNFVGKLSHYVGKATLKIKYQSSNNIGKAIERIKQGQMLLNTKNTSMDILYVGNLMISMKFMGCLQNKLL